MTNKNKNKNKSKQNRNKAGQKTTMSGESSRDRCSDSNADEEDFVGELEGLFSGFGHDGEILDEDSDDEFVTLADHQSTDYSLTCRVFPSAAELKLRVLQDLQLRGREVEDDAVREQLSATECLSATGAVIWNSGVVLGRFLQWQCLHSDTFRQFMRDSNCIEVGSGTGLCGLLAAASGAHVALTDRAEMLPLLRKNLEQNSPGLIAERSRVCEYNWGGSLDALRHLDLAAGSASTAQKFGPPYDIILAADCVYDFKGIEALLAAFEDLSREHQNGDGASSVAARPTLILLAYDRAIGHVEVYKDFFRAAKRRGLVMERVDPGALDPDFFLPTVWVYQCCFFSHNNASMPGSDCGITRVDIPLNQLPFRWHVPAENAALPSASQSPHETDFGASEVSVAAAKAHVDAETAAAADSDVTSVRHSEILVKEVEALKAENAALRAEVAMLRQNARSSAIGSEGTNPFGSDDDSDIADHIATKPSSEAIAIAAKDAATKARAAAEALDRFVLLNGNSKPSIAASDVQDSSVDNAFANAPGNVREISMISSLVSARGQAQSIAIRVTELQEHLILNSLRPRSQMELIKK